VYALFVILTYRAHVIRGVSASPFRRPWPSAFWTSSSWSSAWTVDTATSSGEVVWTTAMAAVPSCRARGRIV